MAHQNSERDLVTFQNDLHIRNINILKIEFWWTSLARSTWRQALRSALNALIRRRYQVGSVFLVANDTVSSWEPMLYIISASSSAGTRSMSAFLDGESSELFFMLTNIDSVNSQAATAPPFSFLSVLSYVHQFRSLYFVFFSDANSDVARRRGTWTKTNLSTSFRNRKHLKVETETDACLKGKHYIMWRCVSR